MIQSIEVMVSRWFDTDKELIEYVYEILGSKRAWLV